ncbi:MAG TPA: aminoglycoside adenylyltransferase domain-containing protein [Polyangiaceae bacterium]|nr:aminoglycoside adenylyltransferase domain-containing protein [Polyangiaceae bacterium]
MIHVTPYAGLNAVLSHLLEGARALLGDNFIGAYLQGSFAVGDFTPYSDCDFIIVTRRDLARDELPPFQALHAAIHELPEPYWRTGLEGSYAPIDVLCRWSTTPRDPPGEPRPDDWADPGTSGSPPLAYPFWYLDHGSKTLVRSEHDNTRVVRWCLREKGVVLAGPHPREFVEPVTPEALKAEVRATMGRWLATGLEPMHLVAFQAFWVGLFCRILHTLEVGEVTSKKAAMTWARGAFDPSFCGLIERAQALKKGASEAELPADPAEIAATRAFVAYAMRVAERLG